MTVKTRAELKAENSTDFPDNVARLISPADLRGQMDDIVDSMLMLEDSGGLVDDTAYGVSWDGIVDAAPSKNAVYDKIQSIGSGDGGSGIYDTVGDMLVGGVLSYTDVPGTVLVAAGDIVRADQYVYTVVAIDEPDYDLATVDGVRLRVRLTPEGWFPFGALDPDGGGSVDNYAKFRAALDAITREQVNRIIIPPGIFKTTKTLNIYWPTQLSGAGGNLSGGSWDSEILWPAGVIGLMFHPDGTDADDTGHNIVSVASRGYSAHGSSVECLRLRSLAADYYTDLDNHCIFTRCQIYIDRINITTWEGDGIRIYATTGLPITTQGNTNNSLIIKPVVRKCGGWGIKVGDDRAGGHDANQMTFIGPDVGDCWHGGIKDDSFLGNHYIGLHTADCGKRGMVCYDDGGGYDNYYCMNDGPWYDPVTSLYWKEGTAATTLPQTVVRSQLWARDTAPAGITGDATWPNPGGSPASSLDPYEWGIPPSTEIWEYHSVHVGAVPTDPYSSWVEWVPMGSGGGLFAGTYYRTHAVYAVDSSSPNTFVGGYIEGTQTPSWYASKTMVFGGILGGDRPAPGSSGTVLSANNGPHSLDNPVWVEHTQFNSDGTSALIDVKLGTGGTGAGEVIEILQYMNRKLTDIGDSTSGYFPSNNHIRLRDTGAGDLAWETSGSPGGRAAVWTGPQTAFNFGRTLPAATPQPGYWAFAKFAVGSSADNNARAVTNGTAVPTTGAWARGDMVLNRNAAVGSPAGWMCVTAGTFGTGSVPVFASMANLS